MQKIQRLQSTELSSINAGTIRKYELGIQNSKPDQLEKISTAIGFNVSVFLDFNVETVGDVLSLLFSIDDSVNLSLSETPVQKILLTFDTLQCRISSVNGVNLKMSIKKKKLKY